jgi:Flp pilus assembly protein TadG
MKINNNRGAVIVEFVIVALLFLVPLLLGTIDIAIAIYNKQVITNASREGARAGIARTTTPVEDIVNEYCRNRLILTESSQTVNVSGGGAFPNDYTVTVSLEHGFFFLGRNITLTGQTVMRMEHELGGS